MEVEEVGEVEVLLEVTPTCSLSPTMLLHRWSTIDSTWKSFTCNMGERGQVVG